MPQPFDWNAKPIEVRRSLLRMADLWDGNTYAMQRFEDLPKHIQNDIQDVLAFAGLDPTITEDRKWIATGTGYDYKNQSWVKDGVYQPCGHPDRPICGCYGAIHAGQPIPANVRKELHWC